MQELLTRLFGYISGLWRFRWFGLVVVWLVAVGGWIWVSQIPEKYESRARVYIDTNSLLRPLLRGLTIAPNINQRVALMSRTLLARPNLEKLMRMADLDLAITTDEQKEKVLKSLENGVQLSVDRGNAALYSISYVHRDRDTAQKIVRSLITVFIESTLGESRSDGAGAQLFIDDQIKDYEQRLIEAEARLADFKQRHAGQLPGENGGYYQRLEAARSQLKDVSLQLREMENRRQEIRRQLEDLGNEEPEFGFAEYDEMQGSSLYDSRIQGLESQLDNLLLRYTERHPEVTQLQALIAELEVRRQEEIERRMEEESFSNTDMKSSPVYQQMRAMLSEAEARVAELRVRAGEYTQRVADLNEAIGKVPLIEAELKQLDRDYGIISRQHSQLLASRESAHLTEKVEEDGSNVKFRVIDPPFTPLKPTEPNKLILNSAVLVVAIGVGFGLAFLLSLFKPLVNSRYALSELTGLPVLGSVSLVKSATRKRKELKETLAFSLSLFGLLIAFGALNYLPTLGLI